MARPPVGLHCGSNAESNLIFPAGVFAPELAIRAIHNFLPVEDVTALLVANSAMSFSKLFPEL
jgi:hypothetical protein